MFSEEKHGYRSWGGLKKQLESLLCDALKGKISYFYTTYHEVHNAYGRASIKLEKKELVSFSWNIGYEQWEDEYHFLKDNAESLPQAENIWDNQKEARRTLAKEKWMPEGKLCEADFIAAAAAYVNADAAKALCSENYLFRVFAFMDRRVGKRTLIKLRGEAGNLPDWAKQFYVIRCEAEGIFQKIKIINLSKGVPYVTEK